MLIAEDGLPIVITGPVLSTVNIFDVAAGAEKPFFRALPLAIEIASVPFPVILETVTVLELKPEPDTETVPFAVPVLFNEISEVLKLIEVAPV